MAKKWTGAESSVGGDTPPGPGECLPRFRTRVVKELRVPASQVRENSRNFRTHPEYQSSVMRKVFERVGVIGRFPVWEPEPGVYELLDGHLRRDILGDDPVDIAVTDLTRQETDEVLATYDQLTGLAVRDETKLADLLKSLTGLGTPLPEMGWPAYQLEQVIGSRYGTGTGPVRVRPADPPVGVTPPESFPVVGDTLPTEFCCPRCSYKWSGKPG